KIITNVIYRNYLVPQSLAFEYEHFIFHIRRAIRLNKILMNKGASAFTKEIIKHDNISYIYESLNTEPLVKKRHLEHYNKHVEQIKKKSTSTTTLAASISNVTPELIMSTVTPSPSAGELVIKHPVIKSSFKKKMIKLKNNPKKFFKDSKKGYIRVLSNIIP
ncbi:TPA: beta-3-deoxy-D-manno-oct-2-ulosonic acid transferase, partial [Escherichia coli]